ncbi:MAG: hypothetical protein ACKOPG_04185 [Novosphingobium sp.]
MSFMLSLIAAAAAPLPVRPVMPQFQVVDASKCDDPAERKRVFSGEATQGISSGLAEKYNQEWRTYLDARMAQIGMSKEDRSDFAMGVLKSDAFGQLQKANTDLFKQMTDDLDTITASKDEVASCRAIAHMTMILPQVVANADRQYTLMDAGLDAFAAKRTK